MEIKRNLFIIIYFVMLLSSCSTYKGNSSDNSADTTKVYELFVSDFSQVTKDLVKNLDKTGIDNSSILNEYEGRYLNYIFNVDTTEYDLIGKKVAFTRSKIEYFKETRERYHDNSTTVGGSSLYIFNDKQKVESGGHDAFVSMWSKLLLPTEDVVKRLKKN